MCRHKCVLTMFVVMQASLPSGGWSTKPVSAGTQVFALFSFVLFCIFKPSRLLAFTHTHTPCPGHHPVREAGTEGKVHTVCDEGHSSENLGERADKLCLSS